jgi:predicted nuclease of restriction endonuclease-like (RecB) superfamily
MRIQNFILRINKPNDFFIKTNLLKNRYVTDGIIWTVDETIFNKETKLFLIISLNTTAILRYY